MNTRAILLSFALASAAAAQNPLGLAASLEESQVVPPTGSQAAAWAFVQLAGNGQLSLTVDVDALSTASWCELRHGAPGASGAAFLALSGGPKTWVGAATLNATDAAAVAAGQTHVVIGSPAHPSGEIRGQVVERRAQRFVAELVRQNVVPPANWNVQGSFRAHFYEPDNRLVVTFAGTSGTFSDHFELRLGAAGQNGPLLHTWHRQSSQGYSYGESRKLTAAEIQALRVGGLHVVAKGYPYPYTQLESTARGQLEPVGASWAGTLAGSQVVPPSATTVTSVASCYGQYSVDSWMFWTERRPGETACHVRRGGPGTNGPIVFSVGPYGSVLWVQSQTLTATELAWLQNGELYLEIETATGPYLRQQIVPDIEPASSYGAGCPDSNGTLWHLGEIRGIAAVGAEWGSQYYILQMVGHGPRPPNGHGYLLIGFGRQNSGTTTLPLRLDVFGGSPDCYLLTDLPVVLPAGNGAVQFILQLPADQGLRGLEMFGQAVMFDPASQGYFAVTNGLDLQIR